MLQQIIVELYENDLYPIATENHLSFLFSAHRGFKSFYGFHTVEHRILLSRGFYKEENALRHKYRELQDGLNELPSDAIQSHM